MKTTFWFAGLFALGMGLGLAAFQPRSVLRTPAQQAPILLGAHAGPKISSLIARSCRNCHSLQTEWPLYSRIFPFSRMLEQDVLTARSHMNLSAWQNYDDDQKARILAEIGSVVRNRIMPPRRYVMMHPGSRISDPEAQEIYQWTRSERRLLRQAAGE